MHGGAGLCGRARVNLAVAIGRKIHKAGSFKYIRPFRRGTRQTRPRHEPNTSRPHTHRANLQMGKAKTKTLLSMGPTMGPMNPAKTFSTHEGKRAIFSTILSIAFIRSKTLPPCLPRSLWFYAGLKFLRIGIARCMTYLRAFRQIWFAIHWPI